MPKKTKPSKAFIYCRASTPDLISQEISLRNQQERCEAFCRENKYDVFEVVHEIGDIANINQRSKLQTMLQRVTDLVRRPSTKRPVFVVATTWWCLAGELPLQSSVQKIADEVGFSIVILSTGY
jgi:hypothetical protein